MIAIIILGIGLVMVATIFPIALQQTAESIELSTAPAVADQAVATLKARLATWNDFRNRRDPETGRLIGDGIIFPDGAATQAEAENETTLAAREQSDWPNDAFNATAQPGFFPIPCDNFLRLPNQTDTLANYFTNNLVLAENRIDGFPDTDQEIARLVSESLPNANQARPGFIKTKITAFDRVYPPAERYRADGTGLTPPGNPMEHRFITESARRRYTWRAFARRTNTPADQPSPANVGQRVFQVVIFVLKRSEPALRFPGQAYPGNFPNGDPLILATPGTGPPARDTLYPQPWLVLFDSDGLIDQLTVTDPDANYATGQIRCFNEVSRLLSPGSIFIDFATGSPHKVLSRTLGPVGGFNVLQLGPDPSSPAWDAAANGNAGGLSDVGAQFAWIFPPAYDLSTDRFTSDSPVVGVFSTTITVP